MYLKLKLLNVILHAICAKKLIIYIVVCKETLLQILKRSIN